MQLNEAIERCRMHVRRNTWLTESDWRRLLDQSAKQLQRLTNSLVADHRIQLIEGVAVYDLSASGAYRCVEDGRIESTTVTRVSRRNMTGRNLEQLGSPTLMLESGTFSIRLWPVPDAATAGKNLLVRCLHFPDDIDETTLLSTQLPFEPGNHDIVVSGAVLLAERIDVDIHASREIRAEYENGVISMRAQAQNRLPGTSTVRRFDGGR